jgi:DNA invertase Pin-like site-specific DNA recombinase
MVLYPILQLDLLSVLQYNKNEHYGRNTKEGDMEVEIIKANNPFDESSKVRKIDRLRVAAYCRVSTDDEDQIKSYNSMVKYYTDLIQNNNQWVFAGVYADKAITGTKVDKREDFQRLIQDCLDGKIDMVLAKSLPRFARNTLDTLKYVRMLKERGIAVYFEVEKINTMKDGEFLMTILSSVAQQEVENTSAYVKKGLKMKMKRGELVGFQGCLGYDYDVETKSLSINEEGAEVVRYIFDRYVAGAGSTMIARELNEQGTMTIKGNPWTSSSVMGIINNEKYKGDILLGKTFTVDPISKRRLENLGEEDRFYIKDHHEPIVSEETFARAQEIRERRNGGRKSATPGKREKYSRQYSFSCMLECGFCGANLSRRSWHSNSRYNKTIWQCVKSTKQGKRYCPDSKGIPEQVIEEAFIESYKMLCADNKDVLEEFITRVEKTLSEDSVRDNLMKYRKSENNLQAKRKMLLEKYLEGIVSQDVYEETDVGYERKLSDIRANITMLEQQMEDEVSLKRRVADFKKALSKNEVLEEFDRGIFESIIEKVIVGGYDEDGNKDPYKITFIYKTGFKNEIGNAKERFDKSKSMGDKAKELCSHIADEVKDVCSYVSDNTCGDGLPSVEESPINQRFSVF